MLNLFKKRGPKCRCGARAKPSQYGWYCPNSEKEGELFVYHDMVAQSFPPEQKNWIVIKTVEGRYMPAAGGEDGPNDFATEREAWEDLEKLYWGRTDWDEIFESREQEAYA